MGLEQHNWTEIWHMEMEDGANVWGWKIGMGMDIGMGLQGLELHGLGIGMAMGKELEGCGMRL